MEEMDVDDDDIDVDVIAFTGMNLKEENLAPLDNPLDFQATCLVR